MRDYKEITDSVLQRSAEILENKRRRRKVVVRAGSAAAGFCLLVLLGAAVWRGGMSPQEDRAAGQYAATGDHDGESDVVIGDTDGFLPDSGADGENSDLDGNPDGYSSAPERISNGGEVAEQDSEDNFAGGNVSGYFSQFISGAKDDGNATAEGKKMISSYDDGAVYCYAAPENGAFYTSGSLTHAMEEYGDDALYRVVVEIFCDEKVIEVNSEAGKTEADRLFELGYTVALETYDDGEEEHCYFTLHATQEQLTDFAVNGEYGYVIYLYDECVR